MNDSLAGRLPPQNLEAEAGLIGSCLLDPEMIDDVMMVVEVEDFYRESHQIIIREVFAQRSEGRPVDTITIEERLLRNGDIDKIGGLDALLGMVDSVPHSANARYYARIVAEKAIVRGLIHAANEIIDEGYSNRHTADELMDLAESRIFAIRDQREASEIVVASEQVDPTIARVEQRREGIISGLSTGFVDLDEMLGGLAPGSQTILAARPSQGKSALALNIVVQVAASKARVSSLFVSLEMPGGELMERMLAHVADVGAYALRMGKVSDGDIELLREAKRTLTRYAPILIDDTASTTVGRIGAAARRAKARHGIGLLVVDYLQLVTPAASRDNREVQVAAISKGLREIGRELGIPTLVLAQLNRESEKRENREPRLADLRESGAIEANADVVLLLHRPEFYDANDRPGMADLIVAKNRNGATGTITLEFLRNRTLFRSVEQRDPVAEGDY